MMMTRIENHYVPLPELLQSRRKKCIITHGKMTMKTSGIITLVTDFGLSDPYVAMMKGVMLTINPDAHLIDISHQIRVGSILQAAGLIRETFSYFPRGTIHMAVVDPGVGSERRCIGLETEEHLFVGPDNGIFWPVIEDHKETRIVHLTKESYFLPCITRTFHGREVFAPVAAHLSMGIDLQAMGPMIEDPIELHVPMTDIKGKTYHGQVIRVDNFGNLITNIRRPELELFLKSAQPVTRVGNLTIKKLSHIYADVEEGEPLVLINSSDSLEIAVNLGRADTYVGVDPEEIIGTVVKVSRSDEIY
jgi:S-adenosylmethionine hydrolase